MSLSASSIVSNYELRVLALTMTIGYGMYYLVRQTVFYNEFGNFIAV